MRCCIPVKNLHKYPVTLEFVTIDANGQVDLSHLEQLLADSSGKTLVSLMHINNEIGTILDIKAVSDLCKTHGAFLHSDTVQSVGHFP